MKKYLITAFVIVVVLLNGYSLAAGAEIKNTDKAMELKDLGLFNGTADGFELDRKPTRIEGAVMLVRLLGKEALAKQQNNFHPFKDVPQWASPYVGYMYTNGLTKGQSEDVFGADSAMNASQYVTFALRALGYDDSQGDFEWKSSLDKAKEAGILTLDGVNDLKGKSAFLRDDVVAISYYTLKAKLKDYQVTLAERLAESGAISAEKARKAGVMEIFKTDADLQQINANSLAYTAMKDANIYFINYFEEIIKGSNGEELYKDYYYKMNYDATIITKMGSVDFNSMIINGDYLYCLKNNNIVRMKPDGSEQKVICNDSAGRIRLKGDWIYYINSSDASKSAGGSGNPFIQGKLYRVKIDGSEKQKLTEREAGAFWVAENKIFFDGDNGAGSSLYSIDTEGGNETRIFEGASYCIQEYKGKVYFSSSKSGEAVKIYCYNTDKKSVQEVFNTGNVNVREFAVINDRIYFIDATKDLGIGPLCSVKANGTGKVTLEKYNIHSVNYVGEWICYFKWELLEDDEGNTINGQRLYRMKFDGSGREVFDKSSWKKAE